MNPELRGFCQLCFVRVAVCVFRRREFRVATGGAKSACWCVYVRVRACVILSSNDILPRLPVQTLDWS